MGQDHTSKVWNWNSLVTFLALFFWLILFYLQNVLLLKKPMVPTGWFERNSPQTSTLKLSTNVFEVFVVSVFSWNWSFSFSKHTYDTPCISRRLILSSWQYLKMVWVVGNDINKKYTFFSNDQVIKDDAIKKLRLSDPLKTGEERRRTYCYLQKPSPSIVRRFNFPPLSINKRSSISLYILTTEAF